MIEILKRGTKQKTTCKNCGCIFTYESEDVTVEKSENFKKTVVCPQCQTECVLEHKLTR